MLDLLPEARLSWYCDFCGEYPTWVTFVLGSSGHLYNCCEICWTNALWLARTGRARKKYGLAIRGTKPNARSTP